MDWTPDRRCDIKECVRQAFAYVDDHWHCAGHIEILIDRWEAISIDPTFREIIEAIPYRDHPVRRNEQPSLSPAERERLSARFAGVRAMLEKKS